jgi:hypothetical protein
VEQQTIINRNNGATEQEQQEHGAKQNMEQPGSNRKTNNRQPGTTEREQQATEQLEATEAGKVEQQRSSRQPATRQATDNQAVNNHNPTDSTAGTAKIGVEHQISRTQRNRAACGHNSKTVERWKPGSSTTVQPVQ